MLVPLDQIEPSPWQARRRFDQKELQALAVSIRENGMLQPVTLLRAGRERYLLVAGERRVRAAKMIGMEKVPAIIADYEDGQAATLALEENLRRQQLGPFEEADALRQLLTLWGCTQSEGARRMGLSQSALANKLRLLNVSPNVRTAAEEAGLTERHVRALLRLPAEADQLGLIAEIAASSLTVSQTERRVNSCVQGAKKRPPAREWCGMCGFFLNTVNRAVSLMKSAGIPASVEQRQSGDVLEYLVRIPKDKATLH